MTASSTKRSRAEIKALATPRYLERARLLAAMMRVVYLLSASMPGVIPRLKWEKREQWRAGAGVAGLACGDFSASARPAGSRSWRKITDRKLVLAVEGGPSVRWSVK